MSGTISGTKLELTMAFPAGAFTTYGAPACSMNGGGTVAASATEMAGNVTLTWTDTCPTHVYASTATTLTGVLSMKKQ
jgi:hypothetical protein